MDDKVINIFYTDDDEDDIEFFRDAVTEAGKHIHLTTRFDGGSLLHLLQNPPPSPAMIFLDWNMPGHNGAYVLNHIRASEITKHYPVIIFSTSDNVEDIEEARSLGAQMFITKPNSFNEVVDAIKHCITINWKEYETTDKNYIYNFKSR